MTNTMLLGTAIQAVAHTDPGRSGKNNEDSYAIFEADAPSDTSATRLSVAAVADGIGGNNAGEKASLMAVDMLRMVMTRDRHLPVRERLDRALEAANSEVYNASLDRPEFAGMGTTIVAAVICGETLHIAHAGDSRAYLFRHGVLHRLTVDHTWAQEAIEAGYLTPERARTHPNRNVIKRYLGIEERAAIDHNIIDILRPADSDNPYAPRPMVDALQVAAGDVLLLCSDGLTDELQDPEIAAILNKLPLERAVRRLVDLANAKGGRDNITVILLRIEKPVSVGLGRSAPASTAFRSLISRFPAKLWLAAVGILLPALVGGLVWMLLWRPPAPIVKPALPPSTITVAVTATASRLLEATSTPLIIAMKTELPSATLEAIDTLPPTSTPIPGVIPIETPYSPNPTATPIKGGNTTPRQVTPIHSTESTVTAWLKSPPEGNLLYGIVEFEFELSRELPANRGVELVFWRPGQDPMKDGFAPDGYMTGSGKFRLNLDAVDRDPNLDALFEPGDYLWGIRLIQLPSFRPLQLISEARRFHFERRSPNPNIPEPTPTNTPEPTPTNTPEPTPTNTPEPTPTNTPEPTPTPVPPTNTPIP